MTDAGARNSDQVPRVRNMMRRDCHYGARLLRRTFRIARTGGGPATRGSANGGGRTMFFG